MFLEVAVLVLTILGLAAVLVEGLVKDWGVFAVGFADRSVDAATRARAGFAPRR